VTKEDSDDIHEFHPARGTSWTHMPRPLSRRLCPAGQNVRGLIPLIAIIHVMLRWASDFELSESITIKLVKFESTMDETTRRMTSTWMKGKEQNL
jgi:hypothetical protein